MKKILSIAVALMMSAAAFAQTSIVPHVGVGYGHVADMKGTDITGDDIDYGAGVSINIGADIVQQISDNFSVSGGLNYNYFEGTEEKIKFLGQEVKNVLKLGFLDIPLLAHYNFTSHFGAFAGLQPSFLLSAKNDKLDIKDNCKSFQLSVPLGLEYTFNEPIVLGAQVNLPLTKLNDDDILDQKFTLFMLKVGYRFEL
ncbi:MAG: PorT family protein [Bacteroidaceae bacterium]|nr:PorT family protein [Bacteroidaceae bacterium]